MRGGLWRAPCVTYANEMLQLPPHSTNTGESKNSLTHALARSGIYVWNKLMVNNNYFAPDCIFRFQIRIIFSLIHSHLKNRERLFSPCLFYLFVLIHRPFFLSHTNLLFNEIEERKKTLKNPSKIGWSISFHIFYRYKLIEWNVWIQ